MDTRMGKEDYYLDIADAVLNRSTCMRRKYGAIIVRNDEILSTGYNGAPRGRRNCTDVGMCMRETLGIPSAPMRKNGCSLQCITGHSIIIPVRFLNM